MKISGHHLKMRIPLKFGALCIHNSTYLVALFEIVLGESCQKDFDASTSLCIGLPSMIISSALSQIKWHNT